MIYLTKALPWDIAIILLILSGIATIFLAYRSQKMAPWKKNMLIAMGVLISCTVFYGSFIEPRIIIVTKAEIILPTVHDLRIVLLSDLHVGPYKGKKFVQRVVERVNKLEPDLILITGDYVYHASDPLDRLTPLADLHSKYGVYGVMGNHGYDCYRGHIREESYGVFDSSARVLRTLDRVGVNILQNMLEEIPLEENGPLFIGGVGDMCSGNDLLGDALPEITQKSSIILLAHDPSVILDKRTTYAHLIASGHTHGGQIRLPFIGSLVRMPIQIDQSYDQGIFFIDRNTTLAITRGLGEAGPRARLFAWPEIMVLNVQKSM